MDALVVELLRRIEADVNRTFGELLRAHCEDPNAHPHEHTPQELDLTAVKAAVDTALEEAASQIEDDTHSSVSEEETPPPEEPPEEPAPPPPAPESEKPPERVHALHRRLG